MRILSVFLAFLRTHIDFILRTSAVFHRQEINVLLVIAWYRHGDADSVVVQGWQVVLYWKYRDMGGRPQQRRACLRAAAYVAVAGVAEPSVVGCGASHSVLPSPDSAVQSPPEAGGGAGGGTRLRVPYARLDAESRRQAPSIHSSRRPGAGLQAAAPPDPTQRHRSA